MASQQVFQAYAQNKGTLIPGQTISVNNYTVQVERYLSQGGFAHVYLVRTPTPVYNTTHHVLKRIAVANESMLTDVKKEVDIMRLLKGHPNIVHLIDAAWHKIPNGTFEVFILMEYCPGGGIIDMMNRRLRERLTEAEILQIFVDVCEGVAYMHNSRPPLLHRDLKVENILQSSSTSFKLCDFGSATTISNPPTNMQEIRALEAELNRHTTLQYRAPEMVDVYSKRPVNEKSDVWALGVLLYKLCFYTTPFEEHGPLAILNVQYRIPPYPVYSQDMNMLIASMLREHGAQRPTVFELLAHVHRLRGTKSKFSYNVPVPPPLLPRSQPHIKSTPLPNPLDGLVTYGVPPMKSAISPYSPKSFPNPIAPNQGIQARDKVLEAIAPMRRGRPTQSRDSSSRPPSPKSRQENQVEDGAKGWSDTGFGPEHDKVWQAAAEKTSAPRKSSNTDDAWSMGDSNLQQPKTEKIQRPGGFGDDFAEKLWNAPDPNVTSAIQSRISPRPNVNMNGLKPGDTPVTPLAFTGSRMLRPKADRLVQNRDKDAFEGLGLMTSTAKPAPTLGEARKLRTGLAIMSTPATQGDYVRRDADKTNTNAPRPSPSPRPHYLSTTPSQPRSISPVPTPGISSSSWKSPHSASGPSPASAANTDGSPIESRFPSLEELDARFVPSSNALYPSSVQDLNSKYSPQASRQADSHSQYSRLNNIGTSGTGGHLLKPSNIPYSVDGVRSEQVTGIAMRESKDSRRPESNAAESKPSAIDHNNAGQSSMPSSSSKDGAAILKPLLVRKHRSSVSMRPTSMTNGKAEEGPSTTSNNLAPPRLPPRPATNSSPRDWLTGEDYDDMRSHPPAEMPVLRESPRKRASFIEHSDFQVPFSVAAQHVLPSEHLVDEGQSAVPSPTVSDFKRAFPAIERIDTQSISSGLTDNWSPIRRDTELDSSSADEGPEDPSRVRSTAQKGHTPRAKGRQSSVHDLVYQYGGGSVFKEREKEPERLPVQQPIGDYVPRKSRPSGLAPPTKVELERKAPSTSANTSKALSTGPTRSPHSQPSSAAGNQPQKPQPAPMVAKSSSSGRSRPQSMFTFPSKSADSSSAPSANLAPPEEPKPRAARRTSISDMVQRYEAIGGRATPVGSLVPRPPSPIHRPVSAKGTSANLQNQRAKAFPEHSKPIASKTSMSSASDTSSRSGAEPSKSRIITNEPIRQNTGLSRTPTKPRRKLTSEKNKPVLSTPDITPRPRRISVKAEPLITSSSTRPEAAISRSTKPSQEADASRPPKFPHKPAIPIIESSALRQEEPRSPSPERPYQGVGKLIDQWQKKSAEAEQSRPGPPGQRTNFPPRRASMVHGEDR